jgi:dipeptidyl aminopeptidase/acylaminoacyl peptidase
VTKAIRTCASIVFVVVGLCVYFGNARGNEKEPRRFAIKDSIELARFANESTWSVNNERDLAPIASPDGRHFLIITRRGVLATNCIEATIWLFDRMVVTKVLTGISPSPLLPRALTTLTASANEPVVSDVRWLEDSRRIAFLGRNQSSIPHLFIVDTMSGLRSQVGNEKDYVTAFDIRGSVTVYTTVRLSSDLRHSDHDLQSVSGDEGGIYQLLYPDEPKVVGDVDDESRLLSLANDLHVVRDGKEVPTALLWNGRPLQLYEPMLSLSPDGTSLVTIAPVNRIPAHWNKYSSGDFYLRKRWSQFDAWDTDEANPWKAQQYVLVDLESRRVRPILDAPAGPGTFYFLYAATKVLWSVNGKRVLLSNAMLPLSADVGDNRGVDRRQGAVLIVDLATHDVQPVANISKQRERTRYLSDVSWVEGIGQVELRYVSKREKIAPPDVVRYESKSGKWVKVSQQKRDLSGEQYAEPSPVVREDLNRPPVLAARVAGKAEFQTLWDPNPQLASVLLGKAAIYHWMSDRTGAAWSGILVLPPDYSPRVHYPLVIQTHGYEAQSFFSDGIYTTGSGGRALSGAGIVVLQSDEHLSQSDTPDEGPGEVDKLSSAIEQLSRKGIVDRKRVGVIGFSYTCFEVLYALTHRPNLFAAATITDGNNKGYLLYLFDIDIGGRTNPFLRPLEESYGSRPFGGGLVKWAKETPSFNLNRVSTPLQIWSLERGNLMGQWEIYAGLRASQKPVEMLWVPSQRFIPHVLVKPNDRYLSQQGAVDWFRFWLQGYEDPQSDKAEQYRRWEEMCDMQVAQNPKQPAFCVRTKAN